MGAALEARAQESDAESPADSDDASRARTLYQEGVEAMEREAWAEAEDKLEQAFAIRQHYQIAGNLGTAELQRKKYIEAAEHLQFAVDELEKEPGREEERAQLKALLREAKGRIATVQIAVAPSVPVAELRVDGKAVADPNAPLFLPPGRHVLEVRATDGRTATRDLVATEGMNETLVLSLGAPVAPPAPEAPAPAPPAPVKEEEEGARPQWRLAPGIGGIVLGVGFIGGGVGYHVLATNRESDADGLREARLASGMGCPLEGCPELIEAYRTADDAYNASIGFFSAGAAFLAAGVVDLAIALSTSEADDGERAAKLVPMVATEPRGGFFGIKGVF